MDTFFPGALTAVWLGILTSISPCPLATNIAAVSFIGKRIDNPRMVLLSGTVYTLGRIIAYLTLGIILVAGLLSIPKLSYFLQKHMNQLLGPILILAGIFLLELIRFSLPGIGLSQKMQNHAERYGVWGAGLLGIIFALSFCPISAALFFGSLIPLSLTHDSSFLFPSLYGLGTGLPVILFTILITLSTRVVGKFFDKITHIEKWARRLTGIIFLLVGVYYILIYIFEVPL